MSFISSGSTGQTPRWVWLTLGAIVLLTLLVVAALPSARGDDEVGERGPGAAPQSESGTRQSPTVARARSLAV